MQANPSRTAKGNTGLGYNGNSHCWSRAPTGSTVAANVKAAAAIHGHAVFDLKPAVLA